MQQIGRQLVNGAGVAVRGQVRDQVRRRPGRAGVRAGWRAAARKMFDLAGKLGYGAAMGSARVISVNTGPEGDLVVGGKPARTGIDKRPVAGQVAVGMLGLDGDQFGDLEHHGGKEQAVYAYAREDLDWWVERLGRELRNGQFGENITTSGLPVSEAVIGETWRVGTAVVQVTGPRIPCVTFQSWMGEDHWVKRFAAAGRPGAYLRVLVPGTVSAGAAVQVLRRPGQHVTVAESLLAFYGDQDLLRRLLEVEGRGEKWDEIGRRVLRPAQV